MKLPKFSGLHRDQVVFVMRSDDIVILSPIKLRSFSIRGHFSGEGSTQGKTMMRLCIVLLMMIWAQPVLSQIDEGRVGQLPLVGTGAASQEKSLSESVGKDAWIIDTHTHFKGPEQIDVETKSTIRNPKNTLEQVVLPEDYRALADRLGIQSTMVVEAVEQTDLQFNDWMLEQSKSDLICGYVARGDLASDDFLKNYKRYQESGYLKGYRFRNDELHGYLDNPKALEHLKMLERDGMVVDLLIEPRHAKDAIQLAQQFPKLKIVINHCFRAKTVGGQPSDQWKAAVAACAKQSNVFCKLSSILEFAGTKEFADPAPTDLKTYQPVLDHCYDSFGEDRVIFGTNWGVCTHHGEVDDVVGIVAEFLNSKGETVLRKGMRDNAIRVYGILEQHLR